MRLASHCVGLLLAVSAIALPPGPARTAEPVQITVENPAGLEIRLEAASPIRAGASIRLVTTAKRRGYLVLLAVDSTGEARQIFPNIQGDLLPFGATIETNGIRPGKPLIVPDPGNVLGNAELFAPGPGKAAVIALHSPAPVQIVGLTELPEAADVATSVRNVLQMVKGLRILPRAETAKAVALSWSGVALVYDVE